MSADPSRTPENAQPTWAPPADQPLPPGYPPTAYAPPPPGIAPPPSYAYVPASGYVNTPVAGGPGFVDSGDGSNGATIAIAVIGGIVLLGMLAAIVIPSFLNQRAKRLGQSEPVTEVPLDGRSSLPGGHARLSFDPLQSQRELVREKNVDAPYDGSEWMLSCGCAHDYMKLGYFVFKPPIDTPEKVRSAVTQDHNSVAVQAAEPPVFRTIKVGDVDGYEARFSGKYGGEIIYVAIFGPVHSYRFECSASSRTSPYYAQCEQALKSLRVDA